MTDRRARKILFERYWSPKGWKHPPSEPSPEDLDYALRQGVLFPKEDLTHDAAVERLERAKALVPRSAVLEGFVASLTSRRVEDRPALASWFAVQRFSSHAYVGGAPCARCGMFAQWRHDFGATNFARLKWGALPRLFVVDHAFVLERFVAEDHPPPTPEDHALLRALLDAAHAVPPNERARALESAWRPLLRSSQAEREMLVEILVASGVLTPSRTSDADFRQIPLRSDWSDGAALWRGADGVSRAWARELFGWAPA